MLSVCTGWVIADWGDLAKQLPTVCKAVDKTFDKMLA